MACFGSVRSGLAALAKARREKGPQGRLESFFSPRPATRPEVAVEGEGVAADGAKKKGGSTKAPDNAKKPDKKKPDDKNKKKKKGKESKPNRGN